MNDVQVRDRTPLSAAVVAVNAGAVAVSLAIGAQFATPEASIVASADVNVTLVEGLFAAPVVVLSLLLDAILVPWSLYARLHGKGWPLNRAALLVPVLWIVGFAILFFGSMRAGDVDDAPSGETALHAVVGARSN